MRPIIFLNLHVNMVDDMQLTQSLLASYTWMYLSSIKQRDPDFPVSCFLLFWFYCIAAEISSQYSDHTLHSSFHLLIVLSLRSATQKH